MNGSCACELMMHEAGRNLIAVLVMLVLCLSCSWYRLTMSARSHALNEQVPLSAVEGWMLESLPGIGSVTRVQIQAQLSAGAGIQDIKWPQRSQPYVLLLFRDDVTDAASKKALQQR
jgi:hypothetical protein